MSTRLDARSLIDLVLDDGSFSCWDDVVPLNGTGEGEAAPGLLIALARFGGAMSDQHEHRTAECRLLINRCFPSRFLGAPPLT